MPETTPQVRQSVTAHQLAHMSGLPLDTMRHLSRCTSFPAGTAVRTGARGRPPITWVLADVLAWLDRERPDIAAQVRGVRA
jgi:hypothetical protein